MSLTPSIWNKFTIIFFALVALNIVAHHAFIEPDVFTARNYIFHVTTKPLIMSLALFVLVKYLSQKEHQNWLMVAFTYSLLGDVLVMGQGINGLFFAGGIIAFFITQTSYIVYFQRSASGWLGRNTATKVLQVLVVLYATGFYLLLLPHLGGFWILVLLYQISIKVMGVMAVGRRGRVNFEAYIYTAIGAFGLLLANSIFAYSKFVASQKFDELSSILITLSYFSGQYMILKGFVALKAPQPSGA
jgi:uncharacterized membrane protein YhhN